MIGTSFINIVVQGDQPHEDMTTIAPDYIRNPNSNLLDAIEKAQEDAATLSPSNGLKINIYLTADTHFILKNRNRAY